MAPRIWCALICMHVTAASRTFRSAAPQASTSNASVAPFLPPGVAATAAQMQTFEAFYASHTTGRGIWKWSNALTAYTRHFTLFRNTPMSLAEVGVQSGGSIDMWHNVLGPSCHVYGIDINPKTLSFNDQTTTMTLGDQANAAMWQNFFTTVAPGSVDILIDDGGHEPLQMLVTLQQSFPHINPGGFVVIEDIHGERYLQEFFVPAAHFLGTTTAAIDSVHVYPFLLVVQKTGTTALRPANVLTFQGNPVVVSEISQLDAAIASNPGGHVILQNPLWGSLLTSDGLTNLFWKFNGLLAFTMQDNPKGCATQSGEHAPVCQTYVVNGPQQASIIGVHVYATRAVIEVAAAPQTIQAVRKGDAWGGYA